MTLHVGRPAAPALRRMKRRYVRDAHGRFARKAEIPTLTEVAYRDPISVERGKPKRWLWLERALQWFTWNQSRA